MCQRRQRDVPLPDDGARALSRRRTASDGQEFLLPPEEDEPRRRRQGLIREEDEPPLLPVHRLLKLNFWGKKVHEHEMLKTTPAEKFNTFCVIVGEGEFAEACMLPREVDGFDTGIEGHVPRAAQARARVPDARAAAVAGRACPAGGNPTWLLWASFFGVASVRPTLVWGRAKPLPLLGSRLERFVPTTPALFRSRAHPASHPAWTAFVRSAGPGLLVDRVLLAAAQAAGPGRAHAGARTSARCHG